MSEDEKTAVTTTPTEPPKTIDHKSAERVTSQQQPESHKAG